MLKFFTYLFGGLCIAASIIAYGACSSAYVASLAWAWFAVPLGAPVIGWKTFVAFSWARSLLKPYDYKKPADAPNWYPWLMAAWPWICLGVLWLLK